MKLDELEKWFNNQTLPNELPQMKIIDLPLFVNGHLETLKANSGKRVFLPYYERLIKVKNILENGVYRSW